jgi:Domain of unknown function (DUF5668)
MSNNDRCNCRRCTIRSLMGPGIIITIGVLFLLSEMRGGDYDFWRMSPVILIVVGFISLASALAPMDGHVSSNVSSNAPAVAAPGAPGSGPNSSPQNPVAGQGQ